MSFRYGYLAHDTVHEIAQRIKEVLAAKVFAVAKVTIDDATNEVDLDTGLILQSDWVDKTNELVRARIEGPLASIHFSDGNYSYIYNSRLLKGRIGGRVKGETYFDFGHDHFHITDFTEFGRRLLQFKVQDPLPWDTDSYHERDLRIHYEAAGLALPV